VIVLDTNVLSECLKPQPNPKVLAWMASYPRSALFTTTVVEAEILYGVRILPDGARKDSLRSAVKAIFDQDMRGRVIAFDRDCAEAFADIAGTRRALGKPISQFDAMIAAATRSRGAVLATRNVQDFIDCGIELIDPWR
jgi:hypothetical protein